jgi:hypothetical protein
MKIVKAMTFLCGVLLLATGCNKDEQAGQSVTSLYPRDRFYDAFTAQARYSGSDPVECGFMVRQYGIDAQWQDWPADSRESGYFECYVTGLTINTQYEMTPYMVTDSGTRITGMTIRALSAANTIEFVTLATANEFDGSANAADITSTTASLRGATLFLGGSGQRLREYGVYYWAKSDPENKTKVTIVADEEEPIQVNTIFTVDLSNLTPATLYSAQIWGRNDRREVLTGSFDFTTL